MAVLRNKDLEREGECKIAFFTERLTCRHRDNTVLRIDLFPKKIFRFEIIKSVLWNGKKQSQKALVPHYSQNRF